LRLTDCLATRGLRGQHLPDHGQAASLTGVAKPVAQVACRRMSPTSCSGPATRTAVTPCGRQLPDRGHTATGCVEPSCRLSTTGALAESGCCWRQRLFSAGVAGLGCTGRNSLQVLPCKAERCQTGPKGPIWQSKRSRAARNRMRSASHPLSLQDPPSAQDQVAAAREAR